MTAQRPPKTNPARAVVLVDKDGDPLFEPLIPQPAPVPAGHQGTTALQVVSLVFAIVLLVGVLVQVIDRSPHVQTSAQSRACEVRK